MRTVIHASLRAFSFGRLAVMYLAAKLRAVAVIAPMKGQEKQKEQEPRSQKSAKEITK